MPQPISFVPPTEFERLRTLNLPAVDIAALFADMSRLNTLSMIAWAGSGHVGSSLSSLDIVSWLYLNELRSPGAAEGDIYFSSKGHDVPGLYAVMIACGLLPFDQVRALRRLNGLPGHPDVGTPAMVTNTGALGMGISKAKGMAFANRRRGIDARIFVLTGDGELQEGQFWESLPSAVNHGLGEITAIIDHNKMQSDTWVSDTSDLGDLEAKLAAFGWAVDRCNGNDMTELSETLARLQLERERPKVLIADTLKGCGVSFMQSDAMGEGEWRYRYHSGAPSPADYAAAVAELSARINGRLAQTTGQPLQLEEREAPARAAPEMPQQQLIPAYGRALVEQAERNADVVALDADLVLDIGLVPFRERFPDRFIECGIAEQDMVSQAGGLALRGLLPVVHSFSCFLSTRPNEQIYNNATEHTKVVYMGGLSGLLPAGPGHSHQSVRDIGALGSVPGLVMIEPCCEREVAAAVEYCIAHNPDSSFLRLVSIPWAIPFALPADYTLEPFRGTVLAEGDDAVQFAYGPVMLTQAWEARALLSQRHGVSLKVVNLPWLNRVDDAWLAQTVAGMRGVFTLDDHYVDGGQGEMLAARLAALPGNGSSAFESFGLTEVPLCGQNDEVLAAHRLDGASLAGRIHDALSA
jgi:transketolase